MPAYSTLADNELTELIKRGDKAAHDEIYSRYWSTLYRTAYNLIRNKDNAQDCVQDVYISLWTRRKELNITFLKGYLLQAIRYRVLETIRNDKADQTFYAVVAAKTTKLFIENPLIFKELSHLIADAIAALPDDCRECYLMNREEDMTYKQIAARLGISEKTVEKRMSKALKLLKDGLGGYIAAISLMIFLF